MRDAILQELHAEYEQRQQANQRENERRRREAENACPEIGEVLDARQNLIFGALRGILEGRASADHLPQQMEVLNKRVASLLRQHGFAEDYLNPVYRCPVCEDTGSASACARPFLPGCTSRSAWEKMQSRALKTSTCPSSPARSCRTSPSPSGRS